MWVYLLRSCNNPEKKYVGCTTNLRKRLAEHNAGESSHTRKCRPWRICVAVWFRSEELARQFELYLKSGSGRQFANRHLWHEETSAQSKAG